MNKVTVKNTSKRVRSRLGHNFQPKEEKELLVNKRQLLTLQAVRDFEVELAEEPSEPEDEYDKLNVQQVIEAVEEGVYTPDEVIAKEVSGKNRSSLLDKMEELNDGDSVQE